MLGWRMIGALTAILIVGSAASAQSIPANNPHPVRVDVDLVLVNASVTDSENRPVLGLQEKNFILWENKIQQSIESFSSEEIALSAGIVLDLSGSMKSDERMARGALASFLARSSQQDEYFLMTFSDRAEIAHEYTADIAQLQSSVFLRPVRGKTALFDALYLAIEKLKEARNPKKVLLLITDGEDNHSRHSLSDVLQRVKELDIQIYAVGFVPFGAWKLGRGQAVLEELAQWTGGKAFFPSNADKIEEICSVIAEEIKSQYVLTYISTDSRREGKWRDIRVKVEPPAGSHRLTVRAKRGYYGP